jgi:hypothetical protein
MIFKFFEYKIDQEINKMLNIIKKQLILFNKTIHII